jgi:hypothetical protein
VTRGHRPGELAEHPRQDRRQDQTEQGAARTRAGGPPEQEAGCDADDERGHEAPELGLAVGDDRSGGDGRQGALATDLDQVQGAPPRAQGQRPGQGGRHEWPVGAPSGRIVTCDFDPGGLRQLGEKQIQGNAVPSCEAVERFEMAELGRGPLGFAWRGNTSQEAG